ncbi:MAG: calcium/sodium antiporter [Bacteroidetes bacterium]|nr:calcium/sodium antiporter [Bacteroidota bacterium]
MLYFIFFLFLGLVLLVKGADWLVSGASSIAKRFNISDLAIGLTIVAFGTSAPELVVNVVASVQKHQEIVFGNVIGSNIFNLMGILGIVGLIAPLTVQSSTAWKEIPLSFFAALVLFFMANAWFLSDKLIVSRLDGVILLFGFVGFLYYVSKQLKTDESSVSESEEKQLSVGKASLFIGIGLAGLIFGGQLVVDNAIEIAHYLQWSEKIIGLTIVSIGTSLPEFATSVVAVMKKNTDIAVGNIVGSNIFNVLFILATSAIVSPIPYSIGFNIDLLVLLAGTVFLFAAMFLGGRKTLDRWEAGILLLGYVGYTFYLLA